MLFFNFVCCGQDPPWAPRAMEAHAMCQSLKPWSNHARPTSPPSMGQLWASREYSYLSGSFYGCKFSSFLSRHIFLLPPPFSHFYWLNIFCIFNEVFITSYKCHWLWFPIEYWNVYSWLESWCICYSIREVYLCFSFCNKFNACHILFFFVIVVKLKI